MKTFSTFHILVAFLVGLALGVEIAKPMAGILLSSVSLIVSIIAYIIARREKNRYDKEDIETDIPARRN